MLVIRNGFDINEFQPSPSARAKLTHSLGLAFDTPLIGLVGRFNPAKDFENFLNAAAIVHQRFPECHFVLVGKDVDCNNSALVHDIETRQLTEVTHLLGARIDVAKLMAAFSILCLSSRTEGFPTVIGEAMASGVPCVATNVGDTAVLVGDTGEIVPPRDHVALSNALCNMLMLQPQQRESLGLRARKRICAGFSIETCWHEYQRTYHALLESKLSHAEKQSN